MHDLDLSDSSHNSKVIPCSWAKAVAAAEGRIRGQITKMDSDPVDDDYDEDLLLFLEEQAQAEGAEEGAEVEEIPILLRASPQSKCNFPIEKLDDLVESAKVKLRLAHRAYSLSRKAIMKDHPQQNNPGPSSSSKSSTTSKDQQSLISPSMRKLSWFGPPGNTHPGYYRDPDLYRTTDEVFENEWLSGKAFDVPLKALDKDTGSQLYPEESKGSMEVILQKNSNAKSGGSSSSKKLKGQSKSDVKIVSRPSPHSVLGELLPKRYKNAAGTKSFLKKLKPVDVDCVLSCMGGPSGLQTNSASEIIGNPKGQEEKLSRLRTLYSSPNNNNSGEEEEDEELFSGFKGITNVETMFRLTNMFPSLLTSVEDPSEQEEINANGIPSSKDLQFGWYGTRKYSTRTLAIHKLICSDSSSSAPSGTLSFLNAKEFGNRCSMVPSRQESMVERKVRFEEVEPGALPETPRLNPEMTRPISILKVQGREQVIPKSRPSSAPSQFRTSSKLPRRRPSPILPKRRSSSQLAQAQRSLAIGQRRPSPILATSRPSSALPQRRHSPVRAVSRPSSALPQRRASPIINSRRYSSAIPQRRPSAVSTIRRPSSALPQNNRPSSANSKSRLFSTIPQNNRPSSANSKLRPSSTLPQTRAKQHVPATQRKTPWLNVTSSGYGKNESSTSRTNKYRGLDERKHYVILLENLKARPRWRI